MDNEILVYTNSMYRNSLIAMIGVLFLANIYMLLQGNLLMAVPLLLLGALIVTYIRKLPIQRLFIKIWSGLVFIAGAAGLVSSCARMLSNSLTEGVHLTDRIILGDVLLKLVCTVVGIYYYVMLPRSTKIILNSKDIQSDSQEAA